MIISWSRRFAFVHLQKTAGESVTRALAPHLARGDIAIGGTRFSYPVNMYYHKRHGISKHSDAKTLKAFVGDDTWNGFFTFSVVRHPFDRVFSLYEYAQKMHRLRLEDRFRGFLFSLPLLNFDDPLHWPVVKALTETETFSDFIRHPGFLTDTGARPQSTSLTDDKGALVVNEVARLENLNEDFNRICGRIGISGAQLEHHNRSANSERKKRELSPADQAHLAELYAEDFRLFGYPHP